jgi:hypothetical protein
LFLSFKKTKRKKESRKNKKDKEKPRQNMGATEVGSNRKRSFPLGFFFHDLIKALFGWFFKMVKNIFEQTIF